MTANLPDCSIKRTECGQFRSVLNARKWTNQVKSRKQSHILEYAMLNKLHSSLSMVTSSETSSHLCKCSTGLILILATNASLCCGHASAMLNDTAASLPRTIPRSNNTISRRFYDVSKDMPEQLNERCVTASLFCRWMKLLPANETVY